MGRLAAVFSAALLCTALGACGTSNPPPAPDLSCGPHTCGPGTTFDALTCSCITPPDMTANEPTDLASQDASHPTP